MSAGDARRLSSIEIHRYRVSGRAGDLRAERAGAVEVVGRAERRTHFGGSDLCSNASGLLGAADLLGASVTRRRAGPQSGVLLRQRRNGHS